MEREYKQMAALYCRLSSEDGEKNGGESESIQNQRSLLKEYARKQGWGIWKIYVDEDWSGLREDRPAFREMLLDGRQGKFSILLCKTQSRFTRNARTAEKYLHEKFPLWGIRFVTVVDHVDTFRKENKKARQINSLVNEWYSEELSENIRAVLKRKREEGAFLGNYAPYGYRKDPLCHHHLVRDGETAEVVRRMFSLCVSGASCKKIAELFTKEGIPTPSMEKQKRGEDLGRRAAERWNGGTVRKILRSPVYLGHMVQGKEEKVSFKENKTRGLPREAWVVVKNTHEPIIEEAVFKQAGERLDSRRKGTKWKKLPSD